MMFHSGDGGCIATAEARQAPHITPLSIHPLLLRLIHPTNAFMQGNRHTTARRRLLSGCLTVYLSLIYKAIHWVIIVHMMQQEEDRTMTSAPIRWFLINYVFDKKSVGGGGGGVRSSGGYGAKELHPYEIIMSRIKYFSLSHPISTCAPIRWLRNCGMECGGCCYFWYHHHQHIVSRIRERRRQAGSKGTSGWLGVWGRDCRN